MSKREPYLGNPQATIAVLNKYGFTFQKKFGQNFLIDPHVLEKIVEAAGVTKDDFVLEIGPGIGTMTQYLCENAREVTAVEIDTNLIPILEDTLSAYDNVTVINEDILKVDIRKIAEEKGIIFSSNISLPAEYAVSDMDMVCVLGNLIDNAIEACEKQTSKYIEVDISEVKKMILIKIVNSYNGEKNDTSVTSKKEKTMHGIGIKNVKKIVAKYKGAYDMECEDDEVVTTVTMLYK